MLCEFYLHFEKLPGKRIQGDKTKEMKTPSAYLGNSELPEPSGTAGWTRIFFSIQVKDLDKGVSLSP